MTIEEMMAVLTAYKEGKKIQVKVHDDWLDEPNPSFDFSHITYRIKPEPHYRPFKNVEEVMEAIKEHGDWVRRSGYEQYDRIICAHDIGVGTGDIGCITYIDAFSELSFLDGTPFGVKEE